MIMKNLASLCVLTLIAFTLTFCKKENTCSIQCLNGGATNNDCGCDCPNGYSGTHCENYNPCYNTVCLNGGICVSGTCNCPTGYTGFNCGTALPLLSVTITRVIVNKFPTATSTGYYWDPGTTSTKYPDIYLNINSGTSSYPYQTSALYGDVNRDRKSVV